MIAAAIAIALTLRNPPPSRPISEDLGDRVRAIAVETIEANYQPDQGGGAFRTPARSYYPLEYALDSWYTFEHAAFYFEPEEIRRSVQRFIDARDANGDFPIAVLPDGSAGLFNGGCARPQSRPTGDPAWALPAMIRIAQEKDGASDLFAKVAPLLEVALERIPRDKETGLVVVDDVDPWIPWGFNDNVVLTGRVLMGSLLYRRAALDMSTLYSLAGASSSAAGWAARAAQVEASLPELVDDETGLLLAATGQNRQPDILGSAFAVSSGAVDCTRAQIIGTWLLEHYAEVTRDGFVRQSPEDWEVGAGAPCDIGPGEYDDGYWTVGPWVYDALELVSPAAACNLLEDWLAGFQPAIEWRGQNQDVNGFLSYMVSATSFVPVVDGKTPCSP